MIFNHENENGSHYRQLSTTFLALHLYIKIGDIFVNPQVFVNLLLRIIFTLRYLLEVIVIFRISKKTWIL